MPRSNQNFGGGFDDWSPQEREDEVAGIAKRKASNAKVRQRKDTAAATRRTGTGPVAEGRPNSVFRDTPAEGPGGQGRLFSPQAEPEAFETKWAKRARTERVPTPERSWQGLRSTDKSPGRGISQQGVRSTLGEQGVTTRGAKSRLRSHWDSAVGRAGGGMPKGQDFYAKEQSDRFEEDSKHFGVPYNVALAVNAVMSPKTALTTPSGLQTNREAAHMVMRHVASGKPGVPDTGGRGLRANAHKGAEIMRQHMESGTHPLDAKDETGHHHLSGPKVEQYYRSYIDPSSSPTDIQHSRILFGPGVRSEMSPTETAHKDSLVEQYGKNSPEVGRFIPKTPAEQLLSKGGVHEWAEHMTSQVASEVGVHPSEFQSVVWHEHKTQRGGRSAVQEETKPLFAPRGAPRSQGKQLQMSQFKATGSLPS